MILTWIGFFRVHSASFTASIILLGFAIGGGNLFSLETLLLIGFGIMFHAIGFGHNNLADYPYDKLDPNKQHHPLISGKISISTARLVVLIAAVLGLVYGGALVGFDFLGVFVLSFAVAAGFLYNYAARQSLMAPFYIAMTFSPLVLYGYLVAGPPFNYLIGLVFLYFVFQILFQIAWSGYLKDIETDQLNLLKKLGGRLSRPYTDPPEVVWRPGPSMILGYGLMSGKIILGLMVVLLWSPSIIGWGPFLFWLSFMVFFSGRLIISRKWDHHKSVMWMALVEATSLYTIVWAVAPLIGWQSSLFITVFFMVYFMALNRVLWKTWLTPRV